MPKKKTTRGRRKTARDSRRAARRAAKAALPRDPEPYPLRRLWKHLPEDPEPTAGRLKHLTRLLPPDHHCEGHDHARHAVEAADLLASLPHSPE